MYKIGDKVEYCGEVVEITQIFDSDGCMVSNGTLEAYAHLSDLDKHKSAHEKLIEMGWEEKIHDTAVKSEVESGRYKQYVKGSEVILIDVEDREFTTYTLYNGDKGVSDVSWVSHELSRILTEYLEELEGKE
jgi:hypothetical protein